MTRYWNWLVHRTCNVINIVIIIWRETQLDYNRRPHMKCYWNIIDTTHDTLLDYTRPPNMALYWTTIDRQIVYDTQLKYNRPSHMKCYWTTIDHQTWHAAELHTTTAHGILNYSRPEHMTRYWCTVELVIITILVYAARERWYLSVDIYLRGIQVILLRLINIQSGHVDTNEKVYCLLSTLTVIQCPTYVHSEYMDADVHFTCPVYNKP